jgi:immune inhibitor A
MRRFVTLAFAALLVASTFSGSAAGVLAGGSGGSKGVDAARGGAKAQPKLVRKWRGDKVTAADLVGRGKATVDAQGRVKLPNGKFVDYRLQGEDHVVTLLVEFTDPAHNSIAEPDPATDNTTYWIGDFDLQHYRDMMFAPGGASYGFPSLRDYFLENSSGRYAVAGQVSNWLQLDVPESEFGANATYGGDDANGPVYRIVDHALQAAAAAGSGSGVDWSPSVVDVWDRYDCDEDGNFDEPDGYIDRITLIHAGEGEEAGGGAQGEDSIWSHSWFANFEGFGTQGPSGCLFGGYQVPGTDLWVGDYTIEPENGGVGVLAHEISHDLGVPDLYDTVGWNDNSVSFWDLMSDGGWPSDDPWSLDTKPVHIGAWGKLLLGWLDGDLAAVSLGESKKLKLGPAEGRTAGAFQAIRVNLPNYTRTAQVFPPEAGDGYYYYSGQGNDLDTTMRRAAPVTSDTSIIFRANYDIELDWDYAYLQYSSDGGTTWTPLETSLSTTTNPYGQNFGSGITGTSGGWVTGTATLPAGTTNVGFRYWTDGAVVGQGFAVDSIQIGGGTLDTAADPSPWTFAGFERVTDGQITKSYFHYYLVESRSYVRNDTSLRGAYLFLRGNWAERQPYADGVLVWYRNSAYADDNVSEHPGNGAALVVDSHPSAMPLVVGKGWMRERWQTWDSSFGLAPHSVTLHAYRGNKLYARTYTAPPVRSFYDSSPTAYYDPRVPFSSVMTAGSGLKIDLLSVSADRTTYQVWVHV